MGMFLMLLERTVNRVARPELGPKKILGPSSASAAFLSTASAASASAECTIYFLY